MGLAQGLPKDELTVAEGEMIRVEPTEQSWWEAMRADGNRQ